MLILEINIAHIDNIFSDESCVVFKTVLNDNTNRKTFGANPE